MKTKVKIFSILSLVTLLFALAQTAVFAGARKDARSAPLTRTVQDSNGQNVEIPFEVTRAGPVIGAFAQMTQVITGGNGKISAAATQNISAYFKQVFPDYERSNPNNYNATSVEDLIASGTQVAYGPDTIFSAEQREQLKSAGVAFVAINNIANVQGMCESFQIIGNILGEEEAKRAAAFVAYYQGNIKTAEAKTANIAPAQKVPFLSLFYSAASYSTTNGRDISNEYIEAAGGVNVAKEYMGVSGGNSLTVDAEQIVKWDPQVIMTNSQAGAQAVLNDPALRTVQAVKNGKVSVCPYGIYLWSVRSGEGAMLPLWLGTKFYPDRFADTNMRDVVRHFFTEFYGYHIPEAEIDKVLAGDATTAMTR
jgi:iron complex transport system substrate-binding protein